MDTLILNPSKRYTYADYIGWLDNKRRELYNGFINLMSAPTRLHQEASGTIFGNLFIFLKNKRDCKVYSAPFDVRLPTKNGETKDGEIYTVVQPDIVVICDPKKLDKKGCIGAPDLVVEILSPSTSKNDLKYKYYIYEKAGVKEYWIAFPAEKVIQIFLLNSNNKYELKQIFVEDDKISPFLFPEISIDINEIFRD